MGRRRLPLLLLLALCGPALAAQKKPAPPPSPWEEFLGEPPTRFERKFLRPARELKAARKLLEARKASQAIPKLRALAGGELGEHALFELAGALREKRDFAGSSSAGERLLRSFPGSVYGDRVRDLLDENECSQGLAAKGEEGISLLERCLWRQPWKAWGEREAEATALYGRLKASKDPLLDSFVSELIQAMPAESDLRKRIAREIPSEKLDQLAALARFRSKSTPAAGVKAVYPDTELFSAGMKLVLKESWSEANELFQRFLAEFPQSDHWDRAQFWLARTEERLGHQEEARKRFEQIMEESPYTYYGLQASIYLKRDWASQLDSPAALPAARWQGAVTTRQALSLWRLRALLTEGLVEYAREEARFLAGARANGAGIGQDDARGALMMAALFGQSGYHMAAFSHAYAALSLDPSLLSQASARLIFPQAYPAEFEAAEERTGVSALLLFSVAKQESAFLPNALSRANAHGLMQLLPGTAREVLPGASREDLFTPSVNAEAGALYLYKLLERYQGNIALALAAYNAGPTRASQWQKDLAESPLMRNGFDPDAFIDSIPFSETRKYVGNILRNYAWYKLLAKDGTIEAVQELNYQWQKQSPKEPAQAGRTNP